MAAELRFDGAVNSLNLVKHCIDVLFASDELLESDP
jgi:hypothetical protein